MLEDGVALLPDVSPEFKMALISFLVNSVPTRELREGRRMLRSSMHGLLSWAIEAIEVMGRVWMSWGDLWSGNSINGLKEGTDLAHVWTRQNKSTLARGKGGRGRVGE